MAPPPQPSLAAAVLAPPPQPSLAAAVLGELERRYVKWRHRNTNYSRLLAFLSFIVLLLSVLFLQRGSHTSYEVGAPGGSGRPPPWCQQRVRRPA